MAEQRASIETVYPSHEGEPWYVPSCDGHEQPWRGTQTDVEEEARRETRAHNLAEHPDLPDVEGALF